MTTRSSTGCPETKQELFNLRFQHVTGQLDNYARLPELKREIARINTELRAREIAAHEALTKQQWRRPMAEETESRPNPRKLREGTVLSASMDKTAVVSVVDRVRHPLYRKTMQRTKKLYVHDEQNDLHVGDRVRVQETRPLSKLKRWRLVEVLERAR